MVDVQTKQDFQRMANDARRDANAHANNGREQAAERLLAAAEDLERLAADAPNETQEGRSRPFQDDTVLDALVTDFRSQLADADARMDHLQEQIDKLGTRSTVIEQDVADVAEAIAERPVEGSAPEPAPPVEPSIPELTEEELVELVEEVEAEAEAEAEDEAAAEAEAEDEDEVENVTEPEIDPAPAKSTRSRAKK